MIRQVCLALGLACALVGCAGDDSTCGLGPSGARCADRRTLLVCERGKTSTVDCTVEDGYCGFDPEDPERLTCLAPGDPCELEQPICQGELLLACAGGGLAITDCAVDGLACGAHPTTGQLSCATECELADVDDLGRCDGLDTGVLCARGSVERLECPGETACAATEAGIACLGGQTWCSTVGPVGECRGELAVRCDRGSPSVTDCAGGSTRCGFDDDGLDAYGCISSDQVPPRVVRGKVFYEDRPPQPDGYLGPTSLRPARGSWVAAVADIGGQVLGVSATANDGSFLLHYDAEPTARVHVLAMTYSDTPQRGVDVVVRDGSGVSYGVASESFDAGAGSRLAIVAAGPEVAPAFNAFDMIVGAYDRMMASGVAIPPVELAWEWGNEDGSYFVPDTGIVLAGGPADDDGYDDVTILHELGHHVHWELSRTDSPGGPHTLTGPSLPTLAFAEGFASYFAFTITGVPIYIDTMIGGGFSRDFHRDYVVADLNEPMSQDIAETVVGAMLWDCGDGGTRYDDDTVGGTTHDAVLAVMFDYLTRPFDDAGATGADLVDWLDGWFVMHGTQTCPQVRSLVIDKYHFPYDFQAPAAACGPQ